MFEEEQASKCSWRNKTKGRVSAGEVRGVMGDGTPQALSYVDVPPQVCVYLASSLRSKPIWRIAEQREGRSLGSWWHCWALKSTDPGAHFSLFKFLGVSCLRRQPNTDNYLPRTQFSSPPRGYSSRLLENLSPPGLIKMKFSLFYFNALASPRRPRPSRC